MLNAGQGKRISMYQTYFLFVPLFSKPLNKANFIIYEKLSRVVVGFRFEEK